MVGKKYGRLTGIKRDGKDKTGNATWLFQCDCGKTIVTAGSRVRGGYTKSCGCLAKEKARELATGLGYASATHHMSRTKSYNRWCAMLRRCENKNVSNYKYYGERGIKVCARWHSFENFWNDVKGKYDSNLELDRIDNNGDYKPSNCRWVSHTVQTNNSRSNRYISFRGEKMTISQWERETGIDRRTISERLDSGWSIKKALTIMPIVGANQFSYKID